MKKAIVMMLAVVLTFSLAIPAVAATDSPKAPVNSNTATAPLPELVESEVSAEDGTVVTIELFAADDMKKLGEGKEVAFTEAQATLKKVVPDGMKVQYFFFLQLTANADEGAKVPPVDVSVKINNVKTVVVMQFIDGEWVECELVAGADGIYTIKGAESGPTAIFTA